MNANATPTIGWAAVCFLPLLLLGVSAVILLVVLLRKRASRPRRRTLSQWSNPGGVWWLIVPGIAVVLVVGGVLFGSRKSVLVLPPERFDGETSFVLAPLVVGMVVLGVLGTVIVVILLTMRLAGGRADLFEVSRTLKRILAVGVPLVICTGGLLGTAVLASEGDVPPFVTAAPLLMALAIAAVAAVLLCHWAFPSWWGRREREPHAGRPMLADRPRQADKLARWRKPLSLIAVVLTSLGLLGVLFAARGGHPSDSTGVLALFALIGGGLLLFVALPVSTSRRQTGQPPVSFWRFVFSKSGALIFLGGVGVAVAVAVVTEKQDLAKLVGSAFIIGMVWWRWTRLKAESRSTPEAAHDLTVAPLLLTPDPTSVRGDCPTCLNPIPADSPHGLCPRCLIRGAMPSPTSTRLRGGGPIDPPTPAEVNEFFPHLEVLELIGAGGMGAVYKVRQPTLDRIVALKIVQSPRGDEDPVFAERFAREARAMAKLDHPSIVTIHESGEAGGLPFLLMEYVDGVTLREAMANRLLTAPEALAVFPQVCDALDFAHRAGVVHRDIKPENILFDQTGRVKIADFGLAKLADPKNVTLTRTQQAMGTPHYMAPEQWERPNEVDHRADIYALGVVLYELLTGELPLGRFALPSEKGKGDAKLDQVVVKALAKDVGERYQNAGQMKAALSGVKLAAFRPVVPPRSTVTLAERVRRLWPW